MANNQNIFIPRSVNFDTSDSDNTSNFLPRYYKTDTNKKFLHSTINQLTQPGVVKKVSGYVGRQGSKSTTSSDIFIDAPTPTRRNYQLEPGFVIEDKLENVTFFKDYQDYINQLRVYGANTSVHSRLNKQEMYSWDPHIDWDKFVNFQNYYWLPNGPDIITIRNIKLKDTTLSYSVKLTKTGEYVFTPDGLTKNPTLTLYRGQTYTFKIKSLKNPFSIKTDRTLAPSDLYTPDGLVTDATEVVTDANGVPLKDSAGNTITRMSYSVTNGTITFTVPLGCPNRLFYVNSNNLDASGEIDVLNLEDSADFNVTDELLGKKSYTLLNGTPLSNGMKVQFAGNVTPVEYATGNFYVEGVGTAIQLVAESQLEAITPYTTSETMLFDENLFDTVQFDDAVSYSGTRDYVVINRGSNDKNYWSRNNRWFHKDIIEISAAQNDIAPVIDQNMRAVRPIIEFEKNLKLFNFGTYATDDISLVDDYTTDAFSIIEGSLGYTVDGVPLTDGQTIIFTAENDSMVRNNIYRVEFIDVKHTVSTAGSSRQIRLVLVGQPELNQVAIIEQGRVYQGKTVWYNGVTWVIGQQKTKVNQFPLFDLFDENGISFGDKSEYLGTTFKGTTIFSYKVGNSALIDSGLGFPLSYKNINNIGDIVFNFSLVNESFIYENSGVNITKLTDSGYLAIANNNDYEFVNGWKHCLVENPQPAIRLYRNSGLTNNFDIDMIDGLPDGLDIHVYVNSNRVKNWAIDKVKTANVQSLHYQVVFDTPVALTDCVMIKVYSNIPINRNGYYEIPINLQNNPLNGVLTEFTLGEVINHVDSIIDHIYYTKFLGNFPGISNLRDIGNVSGYGTRFVQHSGPIGLSLYHITSEDNNIIRAIEQSRDDYCRFKRAFITVASNLGVDTTPSAHVDLILQELTKDSVATAPYYFSDMVPFGACNRAIFNVGAYTNGIFALLNPFTLDSLSNKSVLVYLNDVQLLHRRDYVFTDQGFVEISVELSVGDEVSIVEYENTDGCLVPETPTKLGIWPKYEPKIYLDTTFLKPVNVIQGHDGSIIVAYNDYRDDLILELEKRIYNNIKIKYDTDIFDINDVIPSYVYPNDYTLEEFNLAVLPNYYKWSSNLGVDFTTTLQYDRTNTFTYVYDQEDGLVTPKYWRGVYQWKLGTDRPHICPWEMLGFSEEPLWWVSVYGPAPYTSNNLILWNDLSNGLVKEPGMPEVVIEKYIRPFLSKNIPVDESGNLISPYDSGISVGHQEATRGSFNFGDISPVEMAWRRHSHYPFSVIKTAILLRPAKTIGLLMDRSRIKRNKINQLIYSDTHVRIKIKDIVFPSVYLTGNRVQTSGLINYLINNINCDSLNFYNQYKYNLNMLSAQICYRVSGFTSKEKFNLLLDSKSPTSTGSIFIPQEDYKVILNISSPVAVVTYSGVIITKFSGGFEISGYSKVSSIFKYYKGGSSYGVNVGGISSTFILWDSYQTYSSGSIVKYLDAYYLVTATFTSSGLFDTLNLQALPSLPIIGGASATFDSKWDTSVEYSLSYGTKLYSVQDVVDFLLGYGEWLRVQGFSFEQYSEGTANVINWNTSAKEFLFWTTQNWSSSADEYMAWTDWAPNVTYHYGDIIQYNGEFYKAISTITSAFFDPLEFILLDSVDLSGSSVISLSPGAKTLVFNTMISSVDSLTNPYNTYELLDGSGQILRPHVINTYRTDNSVGYTCTNESGIYCATLYLIQREHVAIIKNTTMFNDTIYNPESGYKQDKIKISGYVSAEWNGSLNVPGFIVDQAITSEWEPWKEYSLGDVVMHRSYFYSATEFVQGLEKFDETKWVLLSKKPTPALLPNWNYKASQFTDFYSLESENFDIDQQRMAQHLTGYQKREYLENIIQDDVSEFKFYQGMIIEKGTQNVLNKLFDVLSADGQDSLTFYEEWAIRAGQYGASSAFENIEFVLDESLFKLNSQGFELVDVPVSANDLVIRQVPNELYLKPLNYKSDIWPAAKSVMTTSKYLRYDEVTKILKSISEIATADITKYVDKEYISVTFAANSSWNVYQYLNLDLSVTNMTATDTNIHITTNNPIEFAVGDYVGIKSEVTTLTGFFKVTEKTTNSFNITANTYLPTNFSTVRLSALKSRRVQSIDNNTYKISELNAGSLLWTDNLENNWKTWKYYPVYNPSSLEIVDSRIHNFSRQIAVNDTGTVMVVSIVMYRDSANHGEALIYSRKQQSEAWVLRQSIVDPLYHTVYHHTNLESFCSSVAVSNDGTWIALGHPGAHDTKGVVSIYMIDDAGTYNLEKTMLSSTPANAEYFGSSLKFVNDTLLVGTAIGNIYLVKYQSTVATSSIYNPNGSSNTILRVASTTGIQVGMNVSGTGFNETQIVIAKLNSTTVELSQAPNSMPAGNISFKKYDWVIVNLFFEPAATEHYGDSIAVSTDGVVVISDPFDGTGLVYVYQPVDNNYEVTIINAPSNSTKFGSFVSVSKNRDFLAVTFLSNAQWYTNVYEYVNADGDFNTTTVTFTISGSTAQFVDDYKTLVVTGSFSSTSIVVDVYNMYETKWIFSERMLATNGANSRFSLAVTDNSIFIGAPAKNNKGKIYEFTKPTNTFSWEVKHHSITRPDFSKIKQAFLYNRVDNTLVKYLDVVDSVHGKHPIIAEQELKYKSSYDPAVYTNGLSTLVNVDSGIAWGPEQVGVLWWDLRTAIFIDSYTDDVVYRSSTLSTLAYGASVDIYEWVETKLLPTDWDAEADTIAGLANGISGTSLYGDSAYTEVKRYDTVSRRFISTYYYWVKNKATIPVTTGRSISAYDVSTLISNPKGDGYEFLSLTGLNSFSLVNIKHLLSHRDVVLSVEYWTTDKIHQNIHTEWKLISSSPFSKLPKNIEQKWIDSLCGKDLADRAVPDEKLPLKLKYGIENRPRQGMFVNRFEALKQYFETVNGILKQYLIIDSRNMSNLQKYDKIPSELHALYDITVDTYADLEYESANYYIKPSLKPVILNGRIVNIVINHPGKGYAVAPYLEIYGLGRNAKIKTIINSLGEITGCEVINSGEGYDYSTTTLSIRSYCALVVSDQYSNNQWCIYSYDVTSSLWSKVKSQTYDVTKYWNTIDWYAPNYDKFSVINFSVDTYTDLNTISATIGQLVKVRYTSENRWILLEKYANSTSYDWAQSYKVVGSENGTIQFSKLLYDFSNSPIGYDGLLYDNIVYDNCAGIELRIILNSIKNDLFIDELSTEYMNLFFTTVRYAMSEQTYIDWIFKTSFVNVTHNVGSLRQLVTYKNDNLSNFEDYVSEVKPYRTQVREYISSYNNMEHGYTAVTDFDMPPHYDHVYRKLSMFSTKTKGDSVIFDYDLSYKISDIVLTSPGTYYISEPNVIISSDSGSGASARATIANGQVTGIMLLSSGTGYLTEPTVYLAGGQSRPGPAAKAVALVTNTIEYPWKSWYDNLGFSVIDVQIVNPGSEYISEPVVSIDSASGSGAVAKVFVSNGQVSRIKLLSEGKGYLTAPTVTISGGQRSNGIPATAVATIGKSVIRSNETVIKFDRITQTVLVTDLNFTDTFTGTGSIIQFALSWAPDLRIGKTVVKINGIELIRDNYTLQVTTSNSGIHSGSITFNVAPAAKSIVTVNYLKNVALLNAVDRIEHYYNPQIGDIGKDFSQLMTGIDYGGVVVSGLTFGASTGWGIAGYSSTKWDTTASIYNYKVTIPRDEYQIILPYTPEDGARLNVYYDNGTGAQPIRIDDANFSLTDTNSNPNAIMATPIFDGVNNILEVPKWFTHENDSYTFVIRDERSDGSEETDDYDVSLNGGTFEYLSASGYLAEDLVIDGDKFDSAFPGPEEVVPGHVVDTIAIKVYTDREGAYMQFKDMLNRLVFKRLAANKQTSLLLPLKYNDLTIELVDGSNFEIPDPSVNMPGVIFVNGERIEYFTITDNTLGQLRRGTLGTGIMLEYPAGTDVQEVGTTETIPYTENTFIQQSSLDNGSVVIKPDSDVLYGGCFVVSLPFLPKRKRVKWDYSDGIPSTYGQCDEVEVFIGGYNYGSVWVSNAEYYINDIVTYGSYVYKCVEDHISTSFNADFNTNVTKSKWVFFIGNIRLQKAPYTVYNERFVSVTNPTGEKRFPADFSVNGKYKEIRISNTFNLAQNTVITVIKKTGERWSYTGAELAFIQAVDQAVFPMN